MRSVPISHSITGPLARSIGPGFTGAERGKALTNAGSLSGPPFGVHYIDPLEKLGKDVGVEQPLIHRVTTAKAAPGGSSSRGQRSHRAGRHPLATCRTAGRAVRRWPWVLALAVPG